MERDATETDVTTEAATEAPRPVRLIIAEDHEMARLGLRTMLAPEADLLVVGEAKTGRETLELCERLQPDLVLMDIRMPDMDGLAATRAIKQAWPDIRVLIITMSEDPNYLLEALKVGAAGHILKDASRREVIAAIRQVLGGESPLDPKLAAQLLKRLAGGIEERGGSQRATGPGVDLTPRELDVIRLVADGKTNAEIAHALFVSVGTVKIHVERIISKLGVSDRTQAAVRAAELGLLRSGE
jgi:DNA-binding NarL/FixJ family response regulator